MTTQPEPSISTRPVRFEVTCVPESIDPLDSDVFSISVEYRGHELWAVLMRSWCLSKSGEWDHEPLPSSREDDWLAEHRFDFDTAMELAREQAPKVTVNGHTVASVLAKYAARQP